MDITTPPQNLAVLATNLGPMQKNRSMEILSISNTAATPRTPLILTALAVNSMASAMTLGRKGSILHYLGMGVIVQLFPLDHTQSLNLDKLACSLT